MAGRHAQRMVQPHPGCEAEIGRVLWAMEDARRRTLRSVEAVSPRALDMSGPTGANTVGALLYHIAAVEASWLYEDVLQQQTFPADIEALFPQDMRDDEGLLSAVSGAALNEYLERLRLVRERLLAIYGAMTVEDFRTPRHIEGQHDVSPEWVLYHLMQHEAEHRGHIQLLIEYAGAARR